MLSNSLAALTIERVIFHDIPQRIQGLEQTLVYSDECTDLAPKTRNHLQRRMIDALGGTDAFDIVFQGDSLSPVPPFIKTYTHKPDPEAFVSHSKTLAKYLFQVQAMNSPQGIVAILDCSVQGCGAIGILKIQREDGGRLTPHLVNGKRGFAYELLNDLILTEGTKFFKNALFIRRAPDSAPEPFEAGACDKQRTNSYGVQVATYFLDDFLGCQFSEAPRIITKRFFEATQSFINKRITDAIVRDDVYEHLRSQLKSETPTVSPYQFADEFIPLDYRQPYVEYLEEHHIRNVAIQKDLSAISGQLRKKAYHTRQGVTVTVPANKEGLVTLLQDEDGQTVITIRDQITRIDGGSS